MKTGKKPKPLDYSKCCISDKRLKQLTRERRSIKDVKIFSGPDSQPMWDEVNDASTIKELRMALYVVCCRIQDLETKIDKLCCGVKNKKP